MKMTANLPRFRGPMLALLGVTMLSGVYDLVNKLVTFPENYRLFAQDFLACGATFWRGVNYIYHAFVPPLLSFLTVLLFLVYILKFCRKGGGKPLMLAVYGITMLDLFMDVVWPLVLPDQRGFLTLASVMTCLLLLLFGYATFSYGIGSSRKLPLLLGPAVAILYSLYLLIFVSIPGIPTMLEIGASPVMIIFGFTLSLCTDCWYSALILFSLGQKTPEKTP